MQYLPLAAFLGFLAGAICAAYITRAYWIDKVKETHDHWTALMIELTAIASGAGSVNTACTLCRHGIENRDAGPPVWVCLHKRARMARGPSPCNTARADPMKCGPEARLWESRAEALARLHADLKRPADPLAWAGEGPAPEWWYTPSGLKVWRDYTKPGRF
jgi:hypothetical protein